MILLQANVVSVPIFKNKKITADTKNDTLVLDNNGNVNIMSNNALSPVTGPLVMTDGVLDGDTSSDQISVYVVRKGDTISQIAIMFGVSVRTILLANNMKKTGKIAPGGVLFILPISGLEHTVTKGQTLRSIAKLYKVDVSDVALYNGIAENSKLAIGDKLLIPGGEMFDEGGDKPDPNLNSSV